MVHSHTCNIWLPAQIFKHQHSQHTQFCCWLSTLIWSLLSPVSRLWSRGSGHGCRKGVLHVLRCAGDSAHASDVSKPRWEDEHLRQVPAEAHQKVLRDAHHGRLHGEHGDHGVFLLHGNALHRRGSFLPLRGLEFLSVLLLLFHNTHHHRVWGFCGPAEEQSLAEKTRLRGVQLHVHPSGVDGHRGLSQPGGATFPDHEQRGRATGRRGESFPGGQPQ